MDVRGGIQLFLHFTTHVISLFAKYSLNVQISQFGRLESHGQEVQCVLYTWDDFYREEMICPLGEDGEKQDEES